MLLGGRPFHFDHVPGEDDWILTIFHETADKYVAVGLNDIDLRLSDSELKEKFACAVDCLEDSV